MSAAGAMLCRVADIVTRAIRWRAMRRVIKYVRGFILRQRREHTRFRGYLCAMPRRAASEMAIYDAMRRAIRLRLRLLAMPPLLLRVVYALRHAAY